MMMMMIIIHSLSQGLVKKQLQKRAVKTSMGLGQHFRKLDQSGDGLLDRQELLRALETYHIKIPKEVKNFIKGFFFTMLVSSEYLCDL